MAVPNEIEIRATHHSCDLLYNGRVFAAVPGAVGKPDSKRPADRARDRGFNYWLGVAWVRRMARGDTRLNVRLAARVATDGGLKKYKIS